MKNTFYALLSLTLVLRCVALDSTPARAESATSVPVHIPEVHVESSFGADGAFISSFVNGVNGARILHGLQVALGPNSQVRVMDVFDNGVLEERTLMHSNGTIFRFVKTGGVEGNGYEAIYATDNKQVCSGSIQSGKRWNGSFLIHEFIPNTYGQSKLMTYKYSKGVVVAKKTFDISELRLPKDSWLVAGISEAIG